jgi:hypothetical protein
MVTVEQSKAGASIPQLALEYDVSESLLYSLANQRRLPGCSRLGRRYVIHRPTFEAWISSGMGEEAGERDVKI